MSVSASTFRPAETTSSAGTQPALAPGQFMTVRIWDPEAQPDLEERHVTILPRSPLETLRLLWREGHVKDLCVTAVLGAGSAVAGYCAATAKDESLQAGDGAVSAFAGGLAAAWLHHTVKKIGATLARDDLQRDESARRPQIAREAQHAEAITRRDQALKEALQPTEEDGRLFATIAREGSYIGVAIGRKDLPEEAQSSDSDESAVEAAVDERLRSLNPENREARESDSSTYSSGSEDD